MASPVLAHTLRDARGVATDEYPSSPRRKKRVRRPMFLGAEDERSPRSHERGARTEPYRHALRKQHGQSSFASHTSRDRCGGGAIAPINIAAHCAPDSAARVL